MAEQNFKGDLKKLTRDLNNKDAKKGVVREYAEALLMAVLLAFIIRSFVIEPYKIPSKSMVPTLLVGDHIFVNKFIYGLRVPGTKKWLLQWNSPKRGDVIVFIYPEDEKLDFIKRVIGLPGDHIRIHEGKLYINDAEVVQKDISIDGVSPDDKRQLVVTPTDLALLTMQLKRIPFFNGYENYQIKLEDLLGKSHLIQRSRLLPNNEEYDVTVPEGHFFVMGDNRDQSADSRVWGFVPRANLKGRALFIWLSLDSDLGGVRLKRFGKEII